MKPQSPSHTINIRPIILGSLITVAIFTVILLLGFSSSVSTGRAFYLTATNTQTPTITATPPITQTAHYYTVATDCEYQFSVQGAGGTQTEECDVGPHPDKAVGIIFTFLQFPPSGQYGNIDVDYPDSGSSSLTTSPAGNIASAGSGTYCIRLTFSGSNDASPICDPVGMTNPPDMDRQWAIGSSTGIGLSPALAFKFYAGYNPDAPITGSVTNVSIIYYGSNDPDPDGGVCSGYVTDQSSSGSIPANQESGIALPALVAGQVYKIEISGGPWMDDGITAEYGVEMSSDGGATWYSLAGHPDADCWAVPDGNYAQMYFTAATGASYQLRVEDDADFPSNTGSIGYTLTEAWLGVEEEVVGLCDGDMEQFPISSCWFMGEEGDGISDSFGRLLDDDPVNGLSACANGYQAIGAKINSGGLTGAAYNEIFQQFYWPGGLMYYHYAVRANKHPIQSLTASYDFSISGVSVSGTIQNLVANTNLTAGQSWAIVTGSVSAPPGYYTINFSLGSSSSYSQDTIYIDDVNLTNTGSFSNCAGGGTPTTTPTPTPTPDGTNNILLNCHFESGPSFWSWSGNTNVVYTFDPNPEGADGSNNYGLAVPAIFYVNGENASSINQSFSWGGGTLYMRFKFRGTGYDVRIVNHITGFDYQFINFGAANGSEWTTVSKAISGLGGGLYKVELRIYGAALSSTYSEYDAISISPNGFSSCQFDPGESVTPTPHPTNTPGPSPTLLPTYEPTPTFTPWPSWTPQPTNTAQPSSTPEPTHTQSDINQTATAQGTDVSTLTPWPTPSPNTPVSTPTPWGGIGVLPLPQPPSSCLAVCTKPTGWSSLNVSQWVEYARCDVEGYISFCPYHAATVVAVPNAFNAYEPFGTINEAQETIQGFEEIINSYDWENTGLAGQDVAPDVGMFTDALPEDSPWNGGTIDIFPSGTTTYSTTCTFSLSEVVGSRLSTSMCFIFNILNQLSLMPWLQTYFNLGVLSMLIFYLWRKWIDLGIQ